MSLSNNIDHAFVMLGLGWLYKASGNPLHKTYLYNTWDMLQSRLIHTDKGFITSVPEPITPRRVQNPHMHMLEAMINLVILFDKDIWKDAAKQLYTLFTRYFCLSHEKKIREFFNDDWSLFGNTGNETFICVYEARLQHIPSII
jgi:mannose-6-phosphate isomerase